MSISELKIYTTLRAQCESTLQACLDLLEERKAKQELEFAQTMASLDVLNRKISFYEDQLAGDTYAFTLYPSEFKK